MPTIILVAGLPGCGKSTYLAKLSTEGWLVMDDFKANAFNDDPRFYRSRKYRALLVAVRDGLGCVVADIDFCQERSRIEAEDVLRIELPGVDFEWRFFANDPAACEANVRRRGRGSLASDLARLAEYAAKYTIPNGAIILPVRSCEEREEQAACE